MITSDIPDLKSITDEIRDSVRRGRFTLSQLEERLKEKCEQAVRSTNNLVHEHPWEAVAVGMGVGVVAGVLLSRATTAPSSQKQGVNSTSPGEQHAVAPHMFQSTLLFVLSAIKAIQAFRAIKL